MRIRSDPYVLLHLSDLLELKPELFKVQLSLFFDAPGFQERSGLPSEL